jgi:hypothetical protein
MCQALNTELSRKGTEKLQQVHLGFAGAQLCAGICGHQHILPTSACWPLWFAHKVCIAGSHHHDLQWQVHRTMEADRCLAPFSKQITLTKT